MSSRFINGEIVLAGNTSGTAVPAGRVGEVVVTSGNSTGTTVSSTSDAWGSGSGDRLEIPSAGVWFVGIGADGTPSDSSVRCNLGLTALSGTFTSLGSFSGLNQGITANMDSGLKNIWIIQAVIVCSAACEIGLSVGALAGGTYSAARVTSKSAVRIA
jgi:hypothetical protein